MNTAIADIMSRIGAHRTGAEKAATNHSGNDCNYADDYYGDQRCNGKPKYTVHRLA